MKRCYYYYTILIYYYLNMIKIINYKNKNVRSYQREASEIENNSSLKANKGKRHSDDDPPEDSSSSKRG